MKLDDLDNYIALLIPEQRDPYTVLKAIIVVFVIG